MYCAQHNFLTLLNQSQEVAPQTLTAPPPHHPDRLQYRTGPPGGVLQAGWAWHLHQRYLHSVLQMATMKTLSVP